MATSSYSITTVLVTHGGSLFMSVQHLTALPQMSALLTPRGVEREQGIMPILQVKACRSEVNHSFFSFLNHHKASTVCLGLCARPW